jgi:hypothetical protein
MSVSENVSVALKVVSRLFDARLGSQGILVVTNAHNLSTCHNDRSNVTLLAFGTV